MNDAYYYCRTCNTYVTRYAHADSCTVGDVVRLVDGRTVEYLGDVGVVPPAGRRNGRFSARIADVKAPVLTDHVID